MSSTFELLYNQLSEDQINQIIQGLRGGQPMNNGIEVIVILLLTITSFAFNLLSVNSLC